MRRISSLFVIVAFAICAAFLPQVHMKKHPPNVLFITVDDLNTDIACMQEQPQALTPNIDRLAESGVLFMNAHASAPICNPSRISLFTGLMPSTTGIYGNMQPLRAALPKAVTLMEYLRGKGYNIAGAGKLFHGSKEDPQSWDDYFFPDLEPLPDKRPLSKMDFPAPFDWGPINASEEEMADVQTVNWAIQYLKREHSKPFFLGVGIFRPHVPMYVPEKYFAPFLDKEITLAPIKENDLGDVPPIGRKLAEPERLNASIVEQKRQKDIVTAYLANVYFADAQVGRILEALKSSPYADNTVIVFLGDNGWHLGEKQHWGKNTLWRESTHVPLILKAPGYGAAGTRCAEVVSLLDLYPTVLDLCGMEAPAELEGTSLLSQLVNQQTPRTKPVVCTAGINNHAVISKDWRYIRYADNTEELYFHPDDPHEWNNLAMLPEYKKIKEQLSTSLPSKNAPEGPSEAKKWKPR